ncbi:hypothetical protein BDW42DRAFT_169284 [Aspergillus taichungensis]|uniref:Uncharacterized protein n=1 Tax=Aspergillus taichungensis TaxID=482145 RepID=A0A2J5HVC2_9EURO|nr:hypothetical protein BDW42DRAFT_169284 [Aspergillus taichungensis]
MNGLCMLYYCGCWWFFSLISLFVACFSGFVLVLFLFLTLFFWLPSLLYCPSGSIFSDLDFEEFMTSHTYIYGLVLFFIFLCFGRSLLRPDCGRFYMLNHLHGNKDGRTGEAGASTAPIDYSLWIEWVEYIHREFLAHCVQSKERGIWQNT